MLWLLGFSQIPPPYILFVMGKMVFRKWIKTEIAASPLTENRGKSLAEVAWFTLLKVRDEIIRGGKWRSSSEVAAAEAEIGEAYWAVVDGGGSLQAFSAACEKWKQVGTATIMKELDNCPTKHLIESQALPLAKEGEPYGLLDLIRADGIILKKVATTHGGEWAGPCPLCREGSDRFRCWPADRGGRWWCRICGKSGDAIQYLIETRGLAYQEACRALGIKPDKRSLSSNSHQADRPEFVPRAYDPPSATWQKKAREFLLGAVRILQAEAGSDARKFLHRRCGLTDETITLSGLGWNPVDDYQDRELWGVPPEKRENGRLKRLWLPAGLVIPCMENGQIIRLRIRRADPGDGPRYILVTGGRVRPMVWNLNRNIIAVLESELDGVLINQAAGDLVGVIALGSVSTRPDQTAHDALQRAERILVCLDSDGPGAKESHRFWPEVYGAKARRWPVPVGKDPSDALRRGLDIRIWISAGLEEP